MKKPSTYAEWVECFERFLEGAQEEEVLQAMEQGTFEWSPGAADRLVERLFHTMEARLQLVSQQMQTEFSRLNGEDAAIVRALLNARRRYAVLNRIVRLKAFPEQVQSQLSDILKKYVSDTQNALEESAKADYTGHLRMLIKNSSLLLYEQTETRAGIAPSPAASQTPGNGTNLRRRVILR